MGVTIYASFLNTPARLKRAVETSNTMGVLTPFVHGVIALLLGVNMADIGLRGVLSMYINTEIHAEEGNEPNLSLFYYFKKWETSTALVSVGVSNLRSQVSHMECSHVTAHTAPSMPVDLVNLSDYLFVSPLNFKDFSPSLDLRTDLNSDRQVLSLPAPP